jgi:HD superfamily phosphohydrolase
MMKGHTTLRVVRRSQLPKSRVIRDPIYGYIALPSELAPVVDHPLFQRLRRIVQTSMTSAVYPTATGSRFEHSLGAMSLATRAWRAAWSNARTPDVRANFLAAAQEDDEVALPRGYKQDQLLRLTELAVGGAALLHDLGHPPFSHVLERFCARETPKFFEQEPILLSMWERYDGAFHEFAGLQLSTEVTKDLGEPLRSTLRAVLKADPGDGSWLGTLHGIIAGEIDIDRLDYLIRDAQKAGTEFGAIDYARLVDAYELHHDGSGFATAPGVRARSAVETLLLQRTQAYKWISFHPRVVCANLALGRSIELLQELASRSDPVQIGGSRLTST